MSATYPGAVLLHDFPADLVLVKCTHCPRRGRYRLVRLLQRFGSRATRPEVLTALSADCERRKDWRITGPCGAGFPALVDICGVTARVCAGEPEGVCRGVLKHNGRLLVQAGAGWPPP